MAKQDLFDEAQEKGLVAADADEGDFTAKQLQALLDGGAAGGDAVAEAIEANPDLQAGNVNRSPVVQSTTTVTPAEADESSLPNALDAKPNDPPVRAAEPDIPIAQTLAAGAGAHTPPDPKLFDKEGRPRSVMGEEA